jgi:hypothetical protein
VIAITLGTRLEILLVYELGSKGSKVIMFAKHIAIQLETWEGGTTTQLERKPPGMAFPRDISETA